MKVPNPPGKSKRAAERLLESSARYLEEELKLKVNRDKSQVTRVTARENLKFLGFAFGRYKDEIRIRIHPKSLKKTKNKLRELTRRNQGRNVRQVMEKQELYVQEWLNYYGLADMKTTAKELDQWLRRRYRVYIWKQWKKPKARFKNLLKLDIPEYHAKLSAGRGKHIGLHPISRRLKEPYQTKDSNAQDTLTYPMRTSLFTKPAS